MKTRISEDDQWLATGRKRVMPALHPRAAAAGNTLAKNFENRANELMKPAIIEQRQELGAGLSAKGASRKAAGYHLRSEARNA